MPTLYSLNIRWVRTPINTAEIERILNSAGDWMRFDAWSWLVATDYSAQAVSEALRAVLTPDDSVLIIRCDPGDYGGFAQQWVWDWINKHQNRPSNALSGGLAGGYVRGVLAADSPLSGGWKPDGDR